VETGDALIAEVKSPLTLLTFLSYHRFTVNLQ